MLPKRKRITKKLFMEILKKGKTQNTPYFLARYILQDDPQYALVVPKTVSKSATDRNRLRRLGYNIIRQEVLPKCVCIFFYKKEIKKLDNKEIKNQILLILKKIQ